MIYLYGLLDPKAQLTPDALTALKGVTGPVEASALPEGWLIFGQAETDDILPKRRHMLAHTRVLEALLQFGALLPMRFGMFAEAPDRIAALLSARSADVAKNFAELEDHTEFGLRVSFDRDAALAATLEGSAELATAHARLGALARPPHFEVAEFGRRLSEALDVRRGQAQRALVKELAPDWADYVLKAPEDDVQVLCVDVLIRANDQDAFAQRAEAAAQAIGQTFAPSAEPIVRVVGPVPPFSFVRLSLGESQSEAA